MAHYIIEVRKVGDGKLLASRVVKWTFEGIGKDVPDKKTSYEEFSAGMKATELYRDTAHAEGKWPFCAEQELKSIKANG